MEQFSTANPAMTAVASVVAVVAAARSLWSPCGLSMLTSINPVAERARGHRYPMTALWFVAGAVLGGAALGGLAALLAAGVRLLSPAAVLTVGVAVVAAAVGVAADLRVGGFHLWEHPRQVNETWLVSYRRWVYAAGFGIQIGCGFATYIMTSAVYLTVLLAALTGSPAAALLVGLVFGLTRGSAVLVGGFGTAPDRLAAVLGSVDRLTTTSRTAALAVQGWAAVSLVGWLLGSWIPAAVAGAAAALLVLALAVPAVSPRRTRRSAAA